MFDETRHDELEREYYERCGEDYLPECDENYLLCDEDNYTPPMAEETPKETPKEIPKKTPEETAEEEKKKVIQEKEAEYTAIRSLNQKNRDERVKNGTGNMTQEEIERENQEFSRLLDEEERIRNELLELYRTEEGLLPREADRRVRAIHEQIPSAGKYRTVQSPDNPNKEMTVFNIPDALTYDTLMEMEVPVPKAILHPILNEGAMLILFAPAGVGKTHVMLTIAKALGNGCEILGGLWTSKNPVPVCILDGEMPLHTIKEWMSEIGIRPGAPLYYYNAVSFSPELGSVNLFYQEWQDTFYNILVTRGIKVFIMDNVTTLYAPKDQQNSAESWRVMQEFVLRLRSAGIATILVDHKGKGEATGPRGTSCKADIADTLIELRRPCDYREEEGARFEVHFVKHRMFSGKHAQAFELWYRDGDWVLTYDLAKPERKESGRPSKSVEIREAYEEAINRGETPTIPGLAKMLNVSEKTIRRRWGELTQ